MTYIIEIPPELLTKTNLWIAYIAISYLCTIIFCRHVAYHTDEETYRQEEVGFALFAMFSPVTFVFVIIVVISYLFVLIITPKNKR